MRKPALRDGVRIEFHVLDFALHLVAVHVHDGVVVARNLHDVVIVEVDNFLRVVDDCGNIACEEKFGVVPDAENQRAATARPDERARFLAADDGKAERAFYLCESLEDGSLQVSLVEASDEVCQDLGIGFGLELDAF